MAYYEEPVIEGFWDSLKAAASRLKKVKPLQVVAREAGVDPRGTLDVVPPPSNAGFGGGTDMNTMLLWGAAIYLLTRKRGR